MNALKLVAEKSKKQQKELTGILGVKQSTLSHRMNKEVQGTIEWSIELAKEIGIKSYSLVKEDYSIHVKIKR